MTYQLNPLEYFLCGGVGGIFTCVVGHPLDTVKVRLQTMPEPKAGEAPLYTGTMDCIKKTIKNEGFFGLYKGMATPLIAVAPIFAISFFGYGVGKKVFQTDRQDYKMLRIFGAGAFSGIFTTSLMAPGERIKVLLQIDGAGGVKKYNGPLDCIKKLYAQGGIKSIYRGSISTMMRDVPGSGLYFMTYQSINDFMVPPGEPASMPVTIFAGGMAGISNWIIGMPADVLKSRLQSAPDGAYPNGVSDVFKEVMKKEGPLGLYKGITPVILRAFPANAACFVGFELAARFIRKMHGAP